MKITTYELKMIPVADIEMFIPEKPFYCFQTGVRRAIRIIPTFITWDSPQNNKGEVYELEVTCVYQSGENKVEKFKVRVSLIENYLNRDGQCAASKISRMLLEEAYYERTEEQFNEDLNNTLDYFNIKLTDK
jgi:hypothetical protein